MLVVHGVVRATDAAEPHASALAEAASGAPVRIVRHRGLAALVTETDQTEPLPSRANLLVHTAILETAASATVLPMRFGVAVPDEDALRDGYLEPEHDALLGRLDRLAGHVEVRLRGTYAEDAVLRDVLESDPRVARLRGRGSFEARMELGERVTAGIEARRGHDAARAVAALEPHAAEVAAGRPAELLDAFTVSFLVDRAHLAAFDACVDRLAEAFAPLVSLELIGPLPPFSFAGGDG